MTNSNKKTTKKKTATKKKEQREHCEYSDFIKNTQKDIIMSHLDEIKKICEDYEGINEVSLDIWKRLNEIVIEVSKAARDCDYTGSYYNLEPKKRATYTISHRVREMQRKKFILHIIESMKENEDMTAHFCNLIFLHIAIWLSENEKIVKQKKDD